MLTGGDAVDPRNPIFAASIRTINEQANTAWSSLNKDKARSCLWPDCPSRDKRSSSITRSYQRLGSMALAYAVKGSPLYHSTELLDDIREGLSWLYANWYNERMTLPTGKQSPENNWWDYEIGTPLALNDILVLLYEQLAQEEIVRYTDALLHYVQDCSRMGMSAGFNTRSTGANLVWKCEITMVIAILRHDREALAADRDKLMPVFEYAAKGDGFHPDGSFVQHEVFAYNAGYGLALFRELNRLVYLLAGSEWDLNRLSNAGNLLQWFYDSFDPLVFKGAFTDMVRGREMSRPASDLQAGSSLLPNVAMLAQFAPAEEAAKLKRIVKSWLADLYPGEPYRSSNLFYLQMVNEIASDPSVAPRGGLVLSKVFAAMERVMHQRPDFAFGISMFSSRTATYESINHENLKGWYTGHGMTYLYTNDDPHPYSNAYWPTVDARRLPGTTVETGERANGEGTRKLSSSDWAGGAELRTYSVAGMELADVFSPLKAHKSWFLFDEEVVALGAGIANTTGNPVETIVDNRQIGGKETLTIDGSVRATESGRPETVSSVTWAHLDGKRIGYYFPQGGALTVLRETRTGAWRDINRGGSDEPLVRSYLTLLVPHGKEPASAGYAYVLLPNRTCEETRQFASRTSVAILANTNQVQAAWQRSLHLIGANFWTAEAVTLQVDGQDYLTCGGKASVLIRETEAGVELAVSDPTQVGDFLELELHRPAIRAIEIDPNVTVLELAPTTRLRIRVEGCKGRTIHASFQ